MMSRFTSVSLRNFRGFASSGSLKLTPLTFLVGPNSAGKTTISSALLFLAQNDILGLNTLKPRWGGPLVDLGSYEDAVHKHMMRREIELSSTSTSFGPFAELADGIEVGVTVSIKGGKDLSGSIQRLKIWDVKSGVDVLVEIEHQHSQQPLLTELTVSSLGTTQKMRFASFSTRVRISGLDAGHIILEFISKLLKDGGDATFGKKAGLKRLCSALEQPFGFTSNLGRTIARVASGRAAPKRWYGRDEYETRQLTEHIRVFDALRPEALRGANRGRSGLSATAMLERLEIGKSFETENISPYHTGIFLKDSATGIRSNIIDFGFGTSQIIPVLRAMELGNGPIVIEQPEIHLHPKAQGHVGGFIAAAAAKRQLIVETHSEHIINRARLAVASGDLEPDAVNIIFVSRNKSGSHATEIGLDRSGNFTKDWPGGFFEERFEDVIKLARLKGKGS